MMQSHGSVAFADEFARGIARSAAVAFEEAFAEVPDSPAPALRAGPGPLHGGPGQLSHQGTGDSDHPK